MFLPIRGEEGIVVPVQRGEDGVFPIDAVGRGREEGAERRATEDVGLGGGLEEVGWVRLGCQRVPERAREPRGRRW
jgi:hypothetical protein